MTVVNKREAILEYLRTITLPQINGKNGYANAVALVTRQWRRITEYQQFPAICILDDLAVDYRRLASDSTYTVGMENDVHTGMMVALVGILRAEQVIADDAGGLSTALNTFHVDIIRAMHTDLTIGGNVYSVTLTSSQNSLQWVEQGFGVIIQTYALKYDFNPEIGII